MTNCRKHKFKRISIPLVTVTLVLFFLILLINQTKTSNLAGNAVTSSASQDSLSLVSDEIVPSSNKTESIINSTDVSNQTLVSSLDDAEQSEQPQLNQPIFDVEVAYAYVGPAASNESFEFLGAPVRPVTRFQSVIFFNFTRIFSSQAQSFDALLEVYLIELKSDTGYLEKFKYFVGTNCSENFQSSNLNNITRKTYSLIDINSIDVERGIFRFDWDLNKSVLGMPIGTIGVYGSGSSELGLWSKGEPQTITINIYRLGWATAQCNIFSSIREEPSCPLLEVQLEKYENGFLYNTVIPESQLTKINLLSPDL